VIAVREYLDPGGRSPLAAAKITTALTRLAGGNFSNVKGIGSGVFECKVDFGPGYRIYFGKDGERLVILLGGGSKAHQRADIAAGLASWREYKKRKKSCPSLVISKKQFAPACNGIPGSGRNCFVRASSAF
jgi:putative addiction module killer protein